MKLKKNESVTVGAKTYKGEIPDAVAVKIGLLEEAPVKAEKETPEPAKKGNKK